DQILTYTAVKWDATRTTHFNFHHAFRKVTLAPVPERSVNEPESEGLTSGMTTVSLVVATTPRATLFVQASPVTLLVNENAGSPAAASTYLTLITRSARAPRSFVQPFPKVTL